ncbi:MAG: hypothetical protein OEZ57_04250 [Nitrospirota bacterium]|nr:hypothetical protein [Nitrospirota bacterium]MDH5587251.1 hypothetical protein [Nitrospirota bacterium]MDH5774111.1 hypothetical protein [Nitrospirota bacterium]
MKIFQQWTRIMTVLSLLIWAGCANMTSPETSDIHSRSIPVSLPERIEDLAGAWKYKDAAGEGIILLNTEGNGAYEWEGGRFETLSLENGTWTGVWIQEGNDREGGFTLTFSDSSSVAEGEWWYTRIGKDADPLQPGGTFRMSRSSAVQVSK